MSIFRALIFGSLFFISACGSISTFGKFRANEGIPAFIKIGTTTRAEVFQNLGEPLVHRFVAGRETAIYNHERGLFFVLYGTYEGNELVIRFEKGIVSEVKMEETGKGWGFIIPAVSNNPGSRRSSR